MPVACLAPRSARQGCAGWLRAAVGCRRSHVINPSIYAKLPYDTAKDFAPITMVASVPILMAVNPRRAGGNGAAVSSRLRRPIQKRSAITARRGVGTVFHLTGQLFNQLSGKTCRCNMCPIAGGGPTVTALLAGEGSARFRNDVVAKAPCPCRRICALWRSPVLDAAPQCLRFRPLPEAGFPELVAEKFVCLVCTRLDTSSDPDTVARKLRWRRSLCRMCAIDCANKAPRLLATARLSWPPMLWPRFPKWAEARTPSWRKTRMTIPHPVNTALAARICDVRFTPESGH